MAIVVHRPIRVVDIECRRTFSKDPIMLLDEFHSVTVRAEPERSEPWFCGHHNPIGGKVMFDFNNEDGVPFSHGARVAKG